jgi:hypothetical protein
MNEENKEEGQATNMVAEALKAHDLLKEQNERMEKNLKRYEENKALETLGGKSEGQPQQQQPIQIDDATYAQMALKGQIV